MKRFVYIPFTLSKTQQSFQEAEKLSKESKLPIRIGEENENYSNYIDIVSFPEMQKINFEEKVKKNFIHCIDITNEFINMNECKMYISYNNEETEVKPIIKEKHLIRIRKRYNSLGNYSFFLKKHDEIICSGDFLVYES